MDGVREKRSGLPNPDSEIVSQIHVIVIAPQTNKKEVTITCLTLQKKINKQINNEKKNKPVNVLCNLHSLPL